ncbi:MAG: ROK family protein [bacterium]
MTAHLVIGADCGGTQVKYVVTTTDGDDLGQGRVATDPDNPEATFQRLATEITASLGCDATTRIEAVGLACAGIVTPDSGHLGRSPNLPGWQGSFLADSVGQAFPDVPAVFANDVNAALFGEWRLGAGRGCHDLVMIALGTGVGGGVIVNGQLVIGSRHGAGEIGHTVLDRNGPECTCGNRGCLEAYAGSWALLRRARELAAETDATAAFRQLVQHDPDGLDTAALYGLAQRGDDSARSLFQAAGRWLGHAVANLVNVLDPERVIIGGGVAQAGELILAPCREVVREYVLAEASRDLPIVPAALGPFAASQGAAAMARERMGPA